MHLFAGGWTQGQTKAGVVGPSLIALRAGLPEAAGRTQARGGAVPRATTLHVLCAIRSAARVGSAFSLLIEDIEAPLLNIPVHIVQAPWIGLLHSHFVRETLGPGIASIVSTTPP